MDKKIIIGIVTLLVVILILVVLKLTILKEDDKPVKEESKDLELTYEINAGIPFKWDYEIGNDEVVSFVRSYVIKDDNVGAITGAKVYTNYVFRGLKPGETTITFKYVNFVEGYTTHIEIHTVKVDEENKVSVVSVIKQDVEQ